MIILCKLNIFFIFNSLLFVLAADLLKNEENGNNSPCEKILLKFKDGTKEISRIDLFDEYNIFVDDNVLNTKKIKIDCLNMNMKVIENYKILTKICKNDKNYKKFNTEITKLNLFKDLIFSNFVSFLKNFSENCFINNRNINMFLTCMMHHFREKLNICEMERYSNKKENSKEENQIEFYLSLIKNRNFESISNFLYIFLYFKREIILKFKDVKCYIRIKNDENRGKTDYKAVRYEIHISKTEEGEINNGGNINNYSQLLDLIQGFVEFHKNDYLISEFSFNIILYCMKDEVVNEGVDDGVDEGVDEGFYVGVDDVFDEVDYLVNEVSEYGKEFIFGLIKILNENNKNENANATRFLYRSGSIKNMYQKFLNAFQFELKETNGEEQPNTEFSVSLKYFRLFTEPIC